MVSKVPIELLLSVLDTAINNDSSVSGATIKDALETLDASIGAKNGFNFEDTVDPKPNTNPTYGVGAKWKNTTSGEIFICTDATTNVNIWVGTSGTLVQSISGKIADNFAYVSGGTDSGGTRVNIIERFDMSASVTTTDVGDLTVARRTEAHGVSSTNHGYMSGGNESTGDSNVIDRFLFSSSANATDIGDLLFARREGGAHSGPTDGYMAGGSDTTTDIQKYDYSSSVTVTDIGDLTRAVGYPASQSSDTHGYTSGGANGNVIDKFSFTSDGNATDVGDLNVGKRRNTGANSADHGYVIGGLNSSNNLLTQVERFTFSSDANAVDVGDLAVGRYNEAASSSSTHAYVAGGREGTSTPATIVSDVDRFAYSSSITVSGIGNLSATRDSLAGHQN